MSARAPAPPAPWAGLGVVAVHDHVLERLLAAHLQLEPALELEDAVLQVLHLEVQLASSPAPGCAAGARSSVLRSDCRERAAIIGFGFQKSFWIGFSSAAHVSSTCPTRAAAAAVERLRVEREVPALRLGAEVRDEVAVEVVGVEHGVAARCSAISRISSSV